MAVVGCLQSAKWQGYALLAMFAFALLSVGAHAASRPDRCLKQAAKAQKQGELQTAILSYRACVELYSHRPAKALRATQRLISLYVRTHDKAGIEAALEEVRNLAGPSKMRPNDLYTLGVLELTHGDPQMGSTELQAALDVFVSRGKTKGAIRAAAKLLEDNTDRSSVELVVDRLQALPEYKLDIKDRAKIARLLLRHQRTNDGLNQLWIIARSSESVPEKHRKTVLRVFDQLADVYANRGDDATLAELDTTLDRAFPSTATWDLVDREQLAQILARLNQLDKASDAWRAIVVDFADNPESDQRKAALRARLALRKRTDRAATAAVPGELDLRDRYRLAMATKRGSDRKNDLKQIISMVKDPTVAQVPVLLDALSALLREASAPSNAAELARWAAARFPTQAFAPNQRYRLGMLLVKYGQKSRAERVLGEVAAGNYGEPTRKALFVLAKMAHRQGDVDLAIERYRDYITRFPNQGFFTLKAYSNLVNVYFSTARSGQARAMLAQLHQVAQGVMDWKGQLNAARQLYRYQQQELADATFRLGFNAALKRLSKTSDELEKIRIRVEIARYAADCKLTSIAMDNAKGATSLAASLDRGPLTKARRNDLDSLHALALLISVREADAGDDARATVMAASDFLDRFPKHHDHGLVAWFLGRGLERQGKIAEARQAYALVDGAYQPNAHARMEALQ